MLDESNAESFVSDVIQKNDGGREMSSRFPCLTPGDWELLHSLFASELVYLVYVECLEMIKPMVVVFVLLEFDATLVIGVEFENLRSFWGIKCLQGYSKTLWMGI